MKKLFLMAAVAAVTLCGCGGKSTSVSEDKAASDSTDKILIVYYSQTGATKAVAEEFQRQLGCDIAAIEAVKPYDGDYGATIQRWREEVDNNVKVEIKPLDVNLDDYSSVFIGYPIWGGTYALPMATFLADNAESFKGKKVVTFSTFGSGGVSTSTRDVVAALPDAEVIAGYGVRNARLAKAPEEIAEFLGATDFLDVEIESLPDYSDVTEVTENDVRIFDEACGSYQFPLGTPLKVASRKTPKGTEYRYEVESQAPDSTKSSSIIFVIAPDDGSAPEFTEVVRF
ncbi:MAG: hypothetical protein K2M04_00860 [Muribaculaceae bacterium]|nr:hypothetical protein [Muribaculaceae bacterium]